MVLGIRRRSALVLALFAPMTMVVLACTGDAPPLIIATAEDGGGTSLGSDGAVGSSDAGANDSSMSSDTGADASSEGGAACASRDLTPCECGASKSCCVFTDGGTLCQPRGNEDEGLGCTTTNILTCTGNCGAGRACCYHGAVTTSTTCPKRLTLFDSQCVAYDAGHPEDACTDTSNGQRHHVMCQTDADCSLFDAGTCQSALMDHVHRIMGVCVP